MENDHKVIGRELGLFSFDENVPGVVYWWPKGWTFFNTILADLRKHLAEDGYQEINTSGIISIETLKKSGHFDNYHEKLFFVGNEKELEKPKWCLKPMSCPGSLIIFNQEIRSYKDLPIKLAEFGTVFRYEQAGEVNGLLRLRNFTQDDAHIYCDENQMKAEIAKLIDFVFETYKRYGFHEIRVELSTRPPKSIGSDEQWNKAEEGLKGALSEKKIEFKINEGDGAFYGPKIDFQIKDSLGRSWQLGTIQLDFAMAERLGTNYIDAEGKKKHPVMIHRAILGSVERFMAILLEQNGGVLPIWLAPVQAMILPIAERHFEYGKKVVKTLRNAGVRVEMDQRNESIGKKIRETEMQKIPLMLIIGDKETESGKVAVRKYGEGDQGAMDVGEIIHTVNQ
jgi:threonyl-tRNA synthetase